ncbi:MAG: TlyA family RNA methyltransferase [Acholeplasmatales bacterium]|nr:TlyA family RNA methyltransferase [Acholeplasmatales bacterium]
MRLDLYLVENNYFESRNKAKAEIENGNVSVNGKVILKSSYDVDGSVEISISDNICPYVSRGGYKLEAAINNFKLNFNDKVILDIGASTGGFTDCALKNGAKLVYSLDVGTSQLHESLRNNNKVIVLENTNIMDYNPDIEFDYLVMDVSFVSIEYLLPKLNELINDNNSLVCLIKPQFEVGKIHLKNGIVKDKNLYLKILENLNDELAKYNLGINRISLSPIKGGDGNKEFISVIKRNIKSNINFLAFVRSIE